MGLGGGWGSKQANPEFSCGHSPRWGGVALPASRREDSVMESSQGGTSKMTKSMTPLPPMEHPQVPAAVQTSRCLLSSQEPCELNTSSPHLTVKKCKCGSIKSTLSQSLGC